MLTKAELTDHVVSLNAAARRTKLVTLDELRAQAANPEKTSKPHD